MNDAAEALFCPLCPLLTGNGYEKLPESTRKCDRVNTRLHFLSLHPMTECSSGEVCQPTAIYPDIAIEETRESMQQQRFHHIHKKTPSQTSA
jgi:hypothetical protein